MFRPKSCSSSRRIACVSDVLVSDLINGLRQKELKDSLTIQIQLGAVVIQSRLLRFNREKQAFGKMNGPVRERFILSRVFMDQCPRRSRLDASIAYNSLPCMHATIYGRGQMVIPARARAEAGINQGDIVEVRPEGNGRIVLVRMERSEDSVPTHPQITRRRGLHAVASTGRSITGAQVRKLLSEL